MIQTVPPISQVAVVGAGLVGASWAVVFARAGLRVQLYDADAAQRLRAREYLHQALRDLETAGLLGHSAAHAAAHVQLADSLEAAVCDAQFVQEAIAEVLPAKQELFVRLDRLTPASTVLASSSSAFTTSAIAQSVVGRNRCLVAHPVNPPHLVPLVEVSGATFTSPETLARTMALMTSIGQSPIQIRREIHGFVLNRLQWTLLAEAYRLVRDGVVSADDVDRAMRDGLGRRWAFMGPFEVGDLNAPQGIADYFTRFGPTIEQIDRERQHEMLALDPNVIATVHAECRVQWPQSQRAQRLASRDQRLLALAVHLNTVNPPEPP